ncbi:MAG: M16 family metallopeptidase [Gemmatimonadaceae bacterium]
MHRTISLALGLSLALAATSPVAAQQTEPPAPGTPHDFSVPEPREFTLANGLEVVFVPYGTIPKVSILLTTRVGNVNEAADEVWIADLTADLMEVGTTTRTAEQIAAEAAQMGGSLNIGVGSTQTTVSGEVLAEFGPQMVHLIADVAQNPSFPESELPRLKADRVRQIAIARSRPQSLAAEKFAAVMYVNHPYGRTFPSPEMVQGFTIEEIRGFYNENFGAARSRLYIVGRFDAAAMEQAVRDAFGQWRRGTVGTRNVPTPTTRRVIYIVDRPGSVQSTIFLGLPVIDPSNEDWVELQVANTLLGGAFSSRITSNIREDKGYTYSPFSSVNARYRDAYWMESADVTTNVTGPSLKEIFYEIDRLQSEPPTREELRGIQNYMAGIFVLQNSTRGGITNQLNFMRVHGLPDEYLNTYVQQIYDVTPQEVSAAVNEYLDDERMTIVIVGDRAQIIEQVKPFGEIVDEGEALP